MVSKTKRREEDQRLDYEGMHHKWFSLGFGRGGDRAIGLAVAKRIRVQGYWAGSHQLVILGLVYNQVWRDGGGSG